MGLALPSRFARTPVHNQDRSPSCPQYLGRDAPYPQSLRRAQTATPHGDERPLRGAFFGGLDQARRGIAR